MVNMLYAHVDGQKLEATPGAKGTCPLCERSVLARCGDINSWHWAHEKDGSCDDWYEPETIWHKNWKLVFGKENGEIVINKEGIKHIADIRTPENIIIELQNSPIQPSVIRKRENFYGERMIWIINGIHFKNKFSIERSKIDEDEAYYQLFSPLASKMNQQSEKSINDERSFSWKSCRKSWSAVEREVFIDFGNDYLFWVKSGMGTSHGKGKKIRKVNFIKKYGGDSKLLSILMYQSEK